MTRRKVPPVPQLGGGLQATAPGVASFRYASVVAVHHGAITGRLWNFGGDYAAKSGRGLICRLGGGNLKP